MISVLDEIVLWLVVTPQHHVLGAVLFEVLTRLPISIELCF